MLSGQGLSRCRRANRAPRCSVTSDLRRPITGVVKRLECPRPRLHDRVDLHSVHRPWPQRASSGDRRRWTSADARPDRCTLARDAGVDANRRDDDRRYRISQPRRRMNRPPARCTADSPPCATLGPSFGPGRATDDEIPQGPGSIRQARSSHRTSGHGDFRMPHEVPRGICGHLSQVEIMGASTIADGADEVLRAVREQLMLGATQIT